MYQSGAICRNISYQFSNASPRDSSFFFLHKLEPQVGDYELRIRISDLNNVFSRPRGPALKRGIFRRF